MVGDLPIGAPRGQDRRATMPFRQSGEGSRAQRSGRRGARQVRLPRPPSSVANPSKHLGGVAEVCGVRDHPLAPVLREPQALRPYAVVQADILQVLHIVRPPMRHAPRLIQAHKRPRYGSRVARDCNGGAHQADIDTAVSEHPLGLAVVEAVCDLRRHLPCEMLPRPPRRPCGAVVRPAPDDDVLDAAPGVVWLDLGQQPATHNRHPEQSQPAAMLLVRRPTVDGLAATEG
mmetsp:Transcript_39288/g.113626  ORF Transcript_39288/g.113626 Transcript_39288/m.113626 type:complete len:231 (+) Transcript_39288:558-1250(+)